FLILTPRGEPIGQVSGYTPPDRFAEFIEQTLRREHVEVFGTVRDDHGEPISGATVVVGIWEGLESGYVDFLTGPTPRPGRLLVETVETDAAGRFRVARSVPTTGEASFFANVFAHKDGYSVDCWKWNNAKQEDERH